ADEMGMLSSKRGTTARVDLGSHGFRELSQQRRARHGPRGDTQRPIENNDAIGAGGRHNGRRAAKPRAPRVEQRGDHGDAREDGRNREPKGGRDAGTYEEQAPGQQRRRGETPQKSHAAWG